MNIYQNLVAGHMWPNTYIGEFVILNGLFNVCVYMFSRDFAEEIRFTSTHTRIENVAFGAIKYKYINVGGYINYAASRINPHLYCL